MKILSIETSCDETAAAIVKDGREVLSSVVASQINEHQVYGGVVPEIASRMHTESIVCVVDKTLKDANLTFSDIDALAVTHAPGLIGALLVGVNFAKGVSLATNLPLIPVHHLRSHIASNYISDIKLEPPFLCLVVSGGHSHIIEVKDYTDLKVIGKTRDDAAGEAFDKAARAMGMPYPGGIHLDKVAETGNPDAFTLPHPKVKSALYDFSFSGLKTNVINQIHNAKQKGIDISIPDLSASFRKTVVDCLLENFIKASYDLGYTKLVVAGGVSANLLLRRRLKKETSNRDFDLFIPNLKYCGDNAAMVGSQAYYEYLKGNVAGLGLNAMASLSIE